MMGEKIEKMQHIKGHESQRTPTAVLSVPCTDHSHQSFWQQLREFTSPPDHSSDTTNLPFHLQWKTLVDQLHDDQTSVSTFRSTSVSFCQKSLLQRGRCMHSGPSANCHRGADRQVAEDEAREAPRTYGTCTDQRRREVPLLFRPLPVLAKSTCIIPGICISNDSSNGFFGDSGEEVGKSTETGYSRCPRTDSCSHSALRHSPSQVLTLPHSAAALADRRSPTPLPS